MLREVSFKFSKLLYGHNVVLINLYGKEYELKSTYGAGDRVSVFKEGDKSSLYVYVLIVNYDIPYVSLSWYNPNSDPQTFKIMTPDGYEYYSALAPISEIFLQEHQVYEALGNKGAKQSTRVIVDKLADMLF